VERYNERKEEDVLVGNVVEDFTDEIIGLLDALKRQWPMMRSTKRFWSRRRTSRSTVWMFSKAIIEKLR